MRFIIVLKVQEGVATFISHTQIKFQQFGSTNIDIGYQGAIVHQYLLQGYSYDIST